MTTRSLTPFIVALAFASTAPIAASQGGSQTPPPTTSKPAETKTETKPATLTVTALVGKWTVTVETGSGQTEATLELKAATDPKDTKTFTGTITSQVGEAQLKGEVVDGKLTFQFTMAGGGGDMNIVFSGTQQKDGGLSGTLDFGQGAINWSAVKIVKS